LDLFAGYRITSWFLSVFSISVSSVTTLIQSRSIQTLPPRYFGWYSYRRRGIRVKEASCDEVKIYRRLVDEARSAAKAEPSGTASSWAALVKRVFEVDPLECPQCGSRMKVVSFIERCQRDVVEKILRHCGLWEGPLRTLADPRGPPGRFEESLDEPRELQLVLDPEFL
jgi:hypothetical protein